MFLRASLFYKQITRNFTLLNNVKFKPFVSAFFIFYGNQPCIMIARDAIFRTFVIVYELVEDK